MDSVAAWVGVMRLTFHKSHVVMICSLPYCKVFILTISVSQTECERGSKDMIVAYQLLANQ